jgi:hypothetical protein
MGDIGCVCPSNEEFSPVLFNQIIDQELGVEAACKVEQVDIEAVFEVLCQNSVVDPCDESFECGGSLVWPRKVAMSLPVWEVERVVPEIPTKSGCQSTVLGKLPYVWMAADGDCEVYAINSVASSCQTLVFRMIRTLLYSRVLGTHTRLRTDTGWCGAAGISRGTRAICTLSLGGVGMNADESLRRCCTVHGHVLEVGGYYEPCHGIRSVTAMASARTRARADDGSANRR